MADIIRRGKIIKGVRGVAYPSPYGGEVIFTEQLGKGNVPWVFMGAGASKLNTFYTQEYTLDDTDYIEPTSTTAQVLKASEDLTARAINTADNEYIIRWRMQYDPVYNSGVTTKALPVRQCVDIYQSIYKRPSNATNLDSDTYNGNVCSTEGTIPVIRYYNTSGTLTAGYTASYGVYIGAVAATFSSTTSNTPNLTIKTPTLSMRTNTTYFNTARTAYLNTADTKIKIIGELWRTDTRNLFRQMYEQVIDLLKNPI